MMPPQPRDSPIRSELWTPHRKVITMPSIEYLTDNVSSEINFPAVGEIWEVDYGGDLRVRFKFHSNSVNDDIWDEG